MSTHHPHDTTPADLLGILHHFGELFPNSRHSPMQLVLVDHAMDETFLRSLLADLKTQRRGHEDQENARMYDAAESGLLTLLLGLPEDMRGGVGRWAPVPPASAWVEAEKGLPAGEGGQGEEGEEGKAAGTGKVDIDELEHPDD